MHLLDTPGVLPPRIESVETGMKLALCGNVTVELIALPSGNADGMNALTFDHIYSKKYFYIIFFFLNFAVLQELFWTI